MDSLLVLIITAFSFLCWCRLIGDTNYPVIYRFFAIPGIFILGWFFFITIARIQSPLYNNVEVGPLSLIFGLIPILYVMGPIQKKSKIN